MPLNPTETSTTRLHLQAASSGYIKLAGLDFTAILSELTEEQCSDVRALLTDLATLRAEWLKKAPRFKEIVDEVVFNVAAQSYAWKAYLNVLRALVIACGLSSYLSGAYGIYSNPRRPDL